jgi:hypothetical protein
MFLVSLAAIYALQLVLNLALEPLALPLPLRLAIVAAAVTALMTLLVIPRAARLLQRYDSRVAFIRDSAGPAAVAVRSRSRSVLRLIIGPSGFQRLGSRQDSGPEEHAVLQ